MDPQDLPAPSLSLEAAAADAVSVLSPLLDGRPAASLSQPAATPGPVHGVVVGTLLAVTDNGLTPLVAYPGQPGTAAIPARSTVDLCGPHIGRHVVLMFEGGDPCRPIVMGVMQGATGWPLAEQPATVDVDADGQRMIVSASEELVLRCGKASITLTKAGKVLIDGTYVSSRSSGVNRVKGGSVQLN